MVELQVVGGGKMGAALLGGLVSNGWGDPESFRVVEPDDTRRAELRRDHPGVDVSDTAGPAAGTIIAVKPVHVPAAVVAAVSAGGGRLLSIAAGVTIGQLEASAGPQAVVIRSMPNTPALVGAGASALCAGTNATPDDVAWAESVLSAVGVVVRVTEAQLDAVTGLSGSGPAYVFLLAEAMIEGGVLAGLARDVATTLTVQTLVGSATLLASTGESPEMLRGAVTSPGGTTAAGLRALEQHGVRAAVLDAVMAATERSRQLANGPAS